MAEKLPYFPLYVDAFDTDDLVIPMTYEAEGAYNALLRFQWRHRTVPDDLRSALPKPVSPEALEQVRPCFTVLKGSQPSRSFNPKLEEIRERVTRRRKRQSEGGREGGIRSGLSRRSQAEANLEGKLKPTRSIASSSSSGSTEVSTPQGTEEQHGLSKALVLANAKALKVREKTADRKTKEAGLDLAAEVVFRYWRDRMGFDPARTLLNEKRKSRIIARLRENGGDVSELLYVVDGALRDDWTMGRDARSTKPYNGTQTIFRDREKLEGLLALVPDRADMHPYLEVGDAQG